ncbi:YHYH protein [Gimesia maris]|uniref:YHYH protein n=1 Tax=Gimesia maris TaxID=122 RepID=UPI001189DABC|nr:YHYH protein [Gimesia maris]QDT77257.1 hypothetical protein Mal35_06830 [Gimesia maris]
MNYRRLTFCIIGVICSTAPVLGYPPPGFGPTGTAATNQVKLIVKGNYRYIYSNGIPDHQAGQFPNRNNPNSIRPQHYEYRVPVEPKVSRNSTPCQHSIFGIAVNGVVFDPGTAEYWNRDFRSGWNYEALSGKINLGLDQSNAHVQPTGAYHYHGLPHGLISKQGKTNEMTLIGVAADGFPIYSQYGYTDADDATSKLRKMKSSFQIKKGSRPGGPGGRYDGTFVADYEYVKDSGDLDECNGRFGVTPEYPEGIYHYYLTEVFPFIPRNFRGTPDPSFQKRGPGPGQHGGPGRGGFGPPPFGGPPAFGRSQNTNRGR